jgi:glycosyltransferase involved in cell wall biosynthesis
VRVSPRQDAAVAVSVLVVTYNHARFVRQALDGALGQRLPQQFEILISEDCSTDGTREILQEYAECHPHLVRLLLSERNLHSNEVVARGFRAARGRYVALLDGDDYWTSDDKLRAQVAFLDARPDLTICFHNVHVVDEHSQSTGRLWNAPGQPEVSGLHELLRGNFIATSSVMYRRAAVTEVPAWYDGFFPVTDWPLHVLYAREGRIGYLDRTLGAYRLHGGGLFSTLGEREKLEANADFYRRLRACSSRTVAAEVARGQRDYFLGWAEEFRRRGDRRMLLRCLRWAWSGRLGAVWTGRWVLPLAGRAA